MNDWYYLKFIFFFRDINSQLYVRNNYEQLSPYKQYIFN